MTFTFDLTEDTAVSAEEEVQRWNIWTQNDRRCDIFNKTEQEQQEKTCWSTTISTSVRRRRLYIQSTNATARPGPSGGDAAGIFLDKQHRWTTNPHVLHDGPKLERTTAAGREELTKRRRSSFWFYFHRDLHADFAFHFHFVVFLFVPDQFASFVCLLIVQSVSSRPFSHVRGRAAGRATVAELVERKAWKRLTVSFCLAHTARYK